MTTTDESVYYLHRLHLLIEQAKELDNGQLGTGDPMSVVACRVRDMVQDLERQIVAARRRDKEKTP